MPLLTELGNGGLGTRSTNIPPRWGSDLFLRLTRSTNIPLRWSWGRVVGGAWFLASTPTTQAAGRTVGGNEEGLER